MRPFVFFFQIGLICFSFLFLGGCDKFRDIEQLKSDVAINKQQMSAVKAELASVSERLFSLETAQKKLVTNDGRQALSAEQIVMLKNVILQCVQIVKKSAPKDDYNQNFYSQFDAFYNPATGRVQNNNLYNGGIPVVYAFNKCMTSLGFPLT